MLLSVHVTSVLFLVWFTLTMGFYWSYTLLLQLPVLMCSCVSYSITTLGLNWYTNSWVKQLEAHTHTHTHGAAVPLI